MAKQDKGKADAPEAKKGKKGKKGKGAEDGEATPSSGISVGAHPTARYQVRRIRGWAGIVGFLVVLWLSHHAGVPSFDAVLRALAGGIVVHIGAWACAVAVWKRLVLAELEAAHDAMNARLAE